MKTISQFMSQDHDRLDEIFQEFRKMKNQDYLKAKHFFDDFKIGLQRHIVWEEEIIFPAFEKRAEMIEGGPTTIMREEHKQIKECLEKIHEKILKQDLKTDEEEKILLDILSAHNVKEKNILYPWIDNALNDTETENIFSQIENLEEEEYNECCA